MSDEQQHSIQNRSVCLSLQQHGDPLTEPRPIDHFVYFTDAGNLAKFAAWAKGLGFEVHELGAPPSNPRKLGLQLVRTDVPSFEGIDAITLPLYREALATGGEYDGWGSPIPGAGSTPPRTLDRSALYVLFGLFLLVGSILTYGVIAGGLHR
jgi:hypothetical protein